MLKKIGYLLKFFSKLINADGTVITEMIATFFKNLISPVVCIGLLQLLNLMAIFGLHRISIICFINHLNKIKSDDKLCKRVKTVKRFVGFCLGIATVIFCIYLNSLFGVVFRTLSVSTSRYWQQFFFFLNNYN